MGSNMNLGTNNQTGGGEQNDKTYPEPDWAHRASKIPHKPVWQDKIPNELWKLGEVFFPIPRGKKGYNYPHHMQEYRYRADDEILNAYLEQGWGYGIACANDLAVVDIDEKKYLQDIAARLPETLWQVSGSGEGYHLFYFVPGLENRQTLFVEEDGEWVHIGEIKCDPHGYVVGPGSVHPSGNKYGPLKGDGISVVTKESLMRVVEDYKKPEPDHDSYYEGGYEASGEEPEDIHSFYELSADDVMPGLSPGKRIAHPVHGSTTGSNFMKNDDRETFTCWRCQYGSGSGCGINGAQYLACEATGMDCEDIRRYWHKDSVIQYKAWREAVDRGLLNHNDIPYKAAHGFAIKENFIDRKEKLSGELYFNILRLLRFLLTEENRQE